MILFFIATLLACGFIAFYIGIRAMSLFKLNRSGYFNNWRKKVFWVMLVCTSYSFILSRFFSHLSDYWIPLVSDIVFAFVLCFFYALVVIDIILLIYRYILKKSFNYVKFQFCFIALGLAFFCIGIYMASSPKIEFYQVAINKPAKVDNLKIVQLSDIHVSPKTSVKHIEEMVEQVNNLHPDYIFITGDTLDSALKPFLDKNLPQYFSKLKAKYGIFTVFGNHEYYGIYNQESNTEQEVIDAFELSGMAVLKDAIFYDAKTGVSIVGRDDYSLKNYELPRADLSSLIDMVEQDEPIILLDHQPRFLDEAENLKVDLMFSGHTHGGQIFPANILVKLLYDNSWGIYQPNNVYPFTSIVSCGFGLWGPPIRLMTQSEIVVTDVYFVQ